MLENKQSALAAVRVRFGTQGNGHSPNYQVHREDGSVRRYSGLSHKLYAVEPHEPFEEGHLSPGEFDTKQVQQMIAERLKAVRGRLHADLRDR